MVFNVDVLQKRTRCRNIGSSFVDTDMDEIVEVAAATASITDKDSNDPDMSLHRTAEEILSGVKKKVEVQYLTHEPATNGKNKRILTCKRLRYSCL